MLKLIVCTDANNGIGVNNKLPWSIKSEMQHFKNTTINHTVVMGRKTYESIGRLLPNRNNIILSNNKNYKVEGAVVTNDVHNIIELSKTQDVFVIGGKSIYEMFLDYCQELIISKLPDIYECDTFLKLNLKFFELKETVTHDEFKVYYYTSIHNKILNGKIAANHIKSTLIEKKNELVKKYKQLPQLVIIQVGDHFASNVYIRNKIKLGEEIGIKVTHQQLHNCTEDELLHAISRLNDDQNVHGILVQLPLPNHINEKIISQAISPIKDVDCFHPQNIGKMWVDPFSDSINTIPCTPYGIIKLLDFYKVDLKTKNVTIVGRSNIVGKPLISLLLANDATVKVCHSKTKDLQKECQWADILIVAIGRPEMIKKNYLKKGVIVIDVGINRDANNQLCGDVDFNDVIDIVGAISPVPFGVGPMTLIMLFNNLLNSYLKLAKF